MTDMHQRGHSGLRRLGLVSLAAAGATIGASLFSYSHLNRDPVIEETVLFNDDDSPQASYLLVAPGVGTLDESLRGLIGKEPTLHYSLIVFSKSPQSPQGKESFVEQMHRSPHDFVAYSIRPWDGYQGRDLERIGKVLPAAVERRAVPFYIPRDVRAEDNRDEKRASRYAIDTRDVAFARNLALFDLYASRLEDVSGSSAPHY